MMPAALIANWVFLVNECWYSIILLFSLYCSHIYVFPAILYTYQLLRAESTTWQSRCIECSCVDDNPSARLIPTSGANLIMMPAAIIANWVEHASRYLRNEVLLGSPNLRQAYTRGKLGHLAPRQRIEDRGLRERTDEKSMSLNCHEDASTIVIITIRGCYYLVSGTEITYFLAIYMAKPSNIRTLSGFTLPFSLMTWWDTCWVCQRQWRWSYHQVMWHQDGTSYYPITTH
jgi:hypothetical protein